MLLEDAYFSVCLCILYLFFHFASPVSTMTNIFAICNAFDLKTEKSASCILRLFCIVYKLANQNGTTVLMQILYSVTSPRR